MGKPEEEQQPLPPGVASEDPPQNAVAECRCHCSGVLKLVGLRCIIVLLLSLAVFLSAAFWLPPFLHLADQENLHADSIYKDHDIVASFTLNKSVSLLEDNIVQLTNEISDEIEAPNIKVVILSLDPLPRSNMTNVVFAVDPDGKYSEMSSTAISLIRALFEFLVIPQPALHLTSSTLFGDPSSFEVLKFKGGITIIPPQSAFPLQTVQTKFNFTLNFSIHKIQSNFNELTSQLNAGLHLTPFENMRVSLSNSEGSTVAAPTIVQASVVLAIGIPPSKERLKQLAQTIMGPHNLGLNNTQFGRVKQVRLSSILQHSLHGNDGLAWSPSPTPLPHPPHHHHHHHQHRHHHHHHNSHLTPVASPTPSPGTVEGSTSPKAGSPAAAKSVPAPPKNSRAQPPNCQSGYRKRPTHNAGKHTHLTPVVAPSIAPHYPVPLASPKSQVEPPTHVSPSVPHPSPVASPKPQIEPPAHAFHSVPALSPLPNVAFAHAEPPPKNEPAAERSHTHLHEPSMSSSSAGCLGSVKWACVMFIVLVLHV